MVLDVIIAQASGNETEHAFFFAYLGIAAALVFANLGSAYGAAKSGVGICTMAVCKPELIITSIIPVVMAGLLGIYGLIVAVILNTGISDKSSITYKVGYKVLGAGLCNGLSSLTAGLAIGIVGDAGVRANAQQSRVFIGMILILIFAEAVALYGFIVSLIVGSSDK